MLKLIMGRFLGDAGGFVDMVAQHMPSPVASAGAKVDQAYSGSHAAACVPAMRACDPSGPLMVNVVKLYSTPDGTAFHALGRVFSGTLRPGEQVKVLGEAYSLDDEEDMAVCEVTGLSLGQGRYRVEVPEARAGNW
ncbi:MAG: EF-Tu/IF-2/RF-3 family GTPase, partial [Pseudomonadota bacterium]